MQIVSKCKNKSCAVEATKLLLSSSQPLAFTPAQQLLQLTAPCLSHGLQTMPVPSSRDQTLPFSSSSTERLQFLQIFADTQLPGPS